MSSDEDIVRALKDAVHSARRKDEEITVKKARSAAETALGLNEGFLKDDEHWKERSKEIIHAAVDETPPSSPAKPKSKSKPPPTAGKKRQRQPATVTKKRQKRSAAAADSDGLSDTGLPNAYDDGTNSTGPAPEAPKAAAQDSAAAGSDTSGLSEHPTPEHSEEDKTGQRKGAESESEMSELIDEPAPRKRAGGKAAKSKKDKTIKPPKVPKKETELSPDEAEIKRLQGWLVKCGIRKVWGVLLKDFDSSKAKIKHLKSMLEEAGMTGRYSNEKASAIKEARELAADLEAVKEGNKRWGEAKDDGGKSDSESEEENIPAPPPRRDVTSRFVDFGDEDEDDD